MLGKYLDPQNDVAFKRIFGQEQNQDILLSLLNQVLKGQLTEPIKEVRFLSPIQDPEAMAQKQSIVDVLCRDKKGTQYIIEMQVAHNEGFKERAQYYAARAFGSQMKKGGWYQDLKEVIFLAFCNFSLFPKKKDYKSEHIILDRKTHEQDLDRLSFTFIELPKFEKQRTKNIHQLTQEEKFYYFLIHAPHINPEQLKVLTKKDIIMQKAYQELDRFYWTPEELLRYEGEEKRIRDNQSVLDYARQEGEQAGIKLGEQRGIKRGKEEGIKLGEQRGIKRGKEEGIKLGEQRGEKKALLKLVKKGLITQEVADEMLEA